jgi:cell division protein FtsA
MNALESKTMGKVVDQQEEVQKEEKVLVEQEHVGAEATLTSHKERKSIFDKWSEKLKDFLDNAE